MRFRSIAAAVAATFAATACVTAGARNNIPQEKTAIRVDNQSFADMTVYALRSSQRVRLGLAPGHSNTIFDVPRTLIAGLTPLRFIANPIGGNHASVSEEITVAPGDSVVMTIPPLQ
jgi:hypothetical protein